MGPEPSSGASRPLKLYTYTQRYAYRRNSSGGLNPVSTAQWVRTSETQCQTVSTDNDNPVCDTSGPRIVTEYAYPANGTTHNNLLPSSTTVRDYASTIVATTEMTYTDQGDTASVNGPRNVTGDITYTTYDHMRRKVFEIGADPDGAGSQDRVIIHHIYSDDGNEIRTETGHGAATNGSDFVAVQYTAMTYDGMGRLIRTETGTP